MLGPALEVQGFWQFRELGIVLDIARRRDTGVFRPLCTGGSVGGFLVWLGALQIYNDAFCFPLVSFATLGYSDIVLAPGYHVFGALGRLAVRCLPQKSPPSIIGSNGPLSNTPRPAKRRVRRPAKPLAGEPPVQLSAARSAGLSAVPRRRLPAHLRSRLMAAIPGYGTTPQPGYAYPPR